MQPTKQVLIIIGHPSKQSLSHKLAQAYEDGVSAAGAQVSVIDVYHDTPQLPLITYEDYSDWPKDEELRTLYQEKIRRADTIAIFHPLWWGSMPAGLKNFIDQVLTPGFAYKFQPRKGVPERFNILPRGFLRGKKARLFITHDAYSLVYMLLGFPFLSVWGIFILFYCGITRMRFFTHQRVRWASEDTRSKWARRAYKKGKKDGGA
jgi:NAD(P)H dehydrogenase (quinone)